MHSAALQELADQFSAIVGAPAPRVTADPHGIHVFTATVDGVDITFSHDPIERPDELRVDVFFGIAPLDREAQVLRELMYANHEFSQHADGPMFCCDPASCQVVLHYARPIEGATGERVWAGMQAMVETVLQWRKGLSAPEDEQGAPANHLPDALGLLA